LTTRIKILKGWVHCFSNQLVLNKYFFLNPEQNLTQILLVVFEKNEKNASLIPKNDVTEPKARPWASAAGDRVLPRIFKYGTNIVNRGLKVRTIFQPFFAILRSFFRCPPHGKFSADALGL